MASKFQFLAVAVLTFGAFAMKKSGPDDEIALEEAALEDAQHASITEVGTLSAAQTVVQPVPEKVVLKVPPRLRASAAMSNGFAFKNSMTHSELESAVSDLFKIGDLGLSKEELAATPFGSSVTKIQELIEKDMMPKVLEAHTMDQNELDKLAKALAQCGSVKDGQHSVAKPSHAKYKQMSPKHQTCRAGEAGIFAEKVSCWEDEVDKRKVRDLKCKEFAMVSAKYSNQNSNKVIVTKGGSEAAQSYITRISSTFCGETGGGGKGGFGKKGFLDEFIKAKEACERATKEHAEQLKKCQGLDKDHAAKQQQCNGLQDQMDNAACKYAVDIKDSCEQYSECFTSRMTAYATAEKVVKGDGKLLTGNEKDRQAEWKGLKRMQCLVKAFSDGKVEQSEIVQCKEATHSTAHLVIKYPTLAKLADCEVPKAYPSTAEYKKAEFAPLPALAKGKLGANECTGVAEISTKPAAGSPSTCKCERVTMNGPYSPGPMVKCVDCTDVRRTADKISCPDGTKLFAPASRSDWKSFLASAKPLRAPNWIIDVTRPQNGCGGCTGNAMNSGNANQKSWVTQDSAPWWLRSTTYSEPNGDYHANCYLDLWHTPSSENSVTWNDGSCSYHAKSYYCQSMAISTTPKSGSPLGCMCEKVELAGAYSAKVLLKCKGCLDVRRSNDKNSCPTGTKLFSPASRGDWKTFLASAAPLRSPHWIIDVTRPQNGCGGCTSHAMNSDNASQKTWGTADGSAWWLRNSRYSEPNGDYHANCYLDLWHSPPNEDSVTWNDGNCNYHANAYYCQLAQKKR